MSDNALNSNFASGDTILDAHIKQIIQAMDGDLVGREGGIATPLQNLGNPIFPWASVHTRSLILNGQVIDPSRIAVASNRITSAPSRAGSSLPDFLRGDALNILFRPGDVALDLSINGIAVSYENDIDIAMQAGFLSNNTATTPGGTSYGEHGGEIDVANADLSNGIIKLGSAGTEITNRVGHMAVFSASVRGGDTEYFFARVRDSETLDRVKRAFCFVPSANAPSTPSPNVSLAGGSTIRILKTGFVFMDVDNQIAPEITYKYPISSRVAPSSNRQVGDFWFDLNLGQWRRYDGSQFVTVNKMPVAIVASEGNNFVAYRCFDLGQNFERTNTVELERAGDAKYILREPAIVSVYGKNVELVDTEWNIEQNNQLDGFTEARSTRYYLYVTEEGFPMFSLLKPRFRLNNYYHPFQAWVCVGEANNNSNGNFVDDLNHFPWQKYNHKAEIPIQDSFLVPAGYEGRRESNPLPINGLFVTGVWDRGTGSSGIVFRPGVFSSSPNASLTPATSNISIGATLSSLTTLQVSTASANTAAGRNATPYYVLLTRSGLDRIQTELNNRL